MNLPLRPSATPQGDKAPADIWGLLREKTADLPLKPIHGEGLQAARIALASSYGRHDADGDPRISVESLEDGYSVVTCRSRHASSQARPMRATVSQSKLAWVTSMSASVLACYRREHSHLSAIGACDIACRRLGDCTPSGEARVSRSRCRGEAGAQSSFRG